VSRIVRLQPCAGGPLLVRGADVIVDEDGVEHPVTRPVVALSMCDRSSRKPWCDATHKAIRGDLR